mmetsp:Transcript_13692/g.20853  ORF Transcript_13692/g.20853 Transcript_13692/m.20853 type:complete len:192 (-) Transcript_13692:593-1168(-)
MNVPGNLIHQSETTKKSCTAVATDMKFKSSADASSRLHVPSLIADLSLQTETEEEKEPTLLLGHFEDLVIANNSKSKRQRDEPIPRFTLLPKRTKYSESFDCFNTTEYVKQNNFAPREDFESTYDEIVQTCASSVLSTPIRRDSRNFALDPPTMKNTEENIKFQQFFSREKRIMLPILSTKVIQATNSLLC